MLGRARAQAGGEAISTSASTNFQAEGGENGGGKTGVEVRESERVRVREQMFETSVGTAPLFSLSPASASASYAPSSPFRPPHVDQAVLFLGFVACAMAMAFVVGVCAAIPALLAMKKAAESIERLAETAREELPGTMAAVRLSGMEISDLTMELSDLSQEIMQGVKRSSQAVQMAEDGLRRAGSFAAARTVSMLQERAAVQVEVVHPAATTAVKQTTNALRSVRSAFRSLSFARGLWGVLPWGKGQGQQQGQGQGEMRDGERNVNKGKGRLGKRGIGYD